MVAAVTPGRLLLSIVGSGLAPGCFIADWTTTHVFNPRWPPHAKFHNGQTMAMGVCLSLAILYYTWRQDPRPIANSGESIKVATVFASLYSVTAIAAWFFPGALAVDPEFGEGFPQLPIFGTMLGLAWVGCWLELSRLSRIGENSARSKRT